MIIKDEMPVGVISFENRGNGEYYLGCLCIIPDFQGTGIGTKAIRDFLQVYSDWKKIILVTPADKTENISLYSKRCGFHITENLKHGALQGVYSDQISFKV